MLFCSFMCNGIVFGIVNSSGQIFEALVEMYHKQNDPDAATKASLVGSMQIGATFALSPVSGILADKFGIRRTAFFGGFIATLGVFLSSFCIDNVSSFFNAYRRRRYFWTHLYAILGTILDNFLLFLDTYVEETRCCLARTKHRCLKIRATSIDKTF